MKTTSERFKTALLLSWLVSEARQSNELRSQPSKLKIRGAPPVTRVTPIPLLTVGVLRGFTSVRISDFSLAPFVIAIVIAMQRMFDHEKLQVYRASLAFLVWLEPVLQKLPKSLSVVEQLDITRISRDAHFRWRPPNSSLALRRVISQCAPRALMNYYLHEPGGGPALSLEELKRRRDAGELNGTELVWRQGMRQWEPVDAVLHAAGLRGATGPLPPPIPKRRPVGEPVVWISAVATVLLVTAVGVLLALLFTHGLGIKRLNGPAQGPVELTSRKVAWDKSTKTEADVRVAGKKFRERIWLAGYRERGPREKPCRSEGLKYIETWLARNYGGELSTNAASLEDWADQLAVDANCKDPLLLTVLAVNSSTHGEWVERLDKALEGFRTSEYPGYPRFYASVTLAGRVGRDRGRVEELDRSSLESLQQALQDGSIQAADQPEIAQLLISGWARAFFHRHHLTVSRMPNPASLPWLAHMLGGEHHVIEAWKARGGGYANTVSEEGWQGFTTHLAQARKSFTAAWQLRPDLSLAASRMVYVALGDSGLADMRLWFDRAVAARIDDDEAWSNMRWGLRPRWYGNEEAMLAFGVTALETRRFDTDVPRKLFDVVADLENEAKLPLGEHIYGRNDIWPHLQRMYEGYLAEPSAASNRDGWRSAYAVVAYLGQKYDVARTQLEALHWQPRTANLNGWGRDLSLMALEVAARTGPLKTKIQAAETARDRGAVGQALRSYQDLHLASLADEKTRSFVEHRLATLSLEAELAERPDGVDILRPGDNDLNWAVYRGEYRRLPDGALEVTTVKGGHLFVCRVRVGRDFEATGEFEIVRSAGPGFQAGLVMGLPELDSSNWYAIRFQRDSHEEGFLRFSRTWAGEALSRPAAYQPGPNSFRVRVQGGRVSAWVNGKELLHQSRPPRGIASRPGEFLLGLGAFNESSGTIVRYRSLHVQKLGRETRQQSGAKRDKQEPPAEE